MNPFSKPLALASIALALISRVADAADLPRKEPAPPEFVPRIYSNAAGLSLRYRLLLPAGYKPEERYPVVLFLHGAAARGSDNLEPLNWGPRLFLEPKTRARHPCFMVVPQCPKESGWVQTSWGGLAAAKESPSLELALELIEKVLPKEFGIDPKRRYLTGVSMGGHAVWITMVRRPGFFAAAVPVCSGGTASMVTEAATRFPIWAFHSDDDHLVPVQQAREMVQAWRKHGGTAKYTEYTGLRHSSWKKAYTEAAMFEWLFGRSVP
jgi:predicted peptidase